MLDEYKEKLEEARALAYKDPYNTYKGMLPWINEGAQQAYEDLYCNKPYRSVHCVEVNFFHLFYHSTDHIHVDLYNRYGYFEMLTRAQTYVDALKIDDSGVDKGEQAKNMFNAIKALVYYWHHCGGLEKAKMGECAVICTQMLYDYGDLFAEQFPNDRIMQETALQFWKEGVRRQTQWKYCGVDEKSFDTKKLDSYVQKIKALDSTYVKPKTPHPLVVWWKGYE